MTDVVTQKNRSPSFSSSFGKQVRLIFFISLSLSLHLRDDLRFMSTFFTFESVSLSISKSKKCNDMRLGSTQMKYERLVLILEKVYLQSQHQTRKTDHYVPGIVVS